MAQPKDQKDQKKGLDHISKLISEGREMREAKMMTHDDELQTISRVGLINTNIKTAANISPLAKIHANDPTEMEFNSIEEYNQYAIECQKKSMIVDGREGGKLHLI